MKSLSFLISGASSRRSSTVLPVGVMMEAYDEPINSMGSPLTCYNLNLLLSDATFPFFYFSLYSQIILVYVH